MKAGKHTATGGSPRGRVLTMDTYRIVGFYGGRERVVAQGLSDEAAREKLAFLQANPVRGMEFCIESEAAAQQWENWKSTTSIPHAR